MGKEGDSRSDIRSLGDPRYVRYYRAGIGRERSRDQSMTASPTEVSVAPESSSDLWITTGDLTRATRFVIKPEESVAVNSAFHCPKSQSRICFKERHDDLV